ncbi:protein lethal(2)essential for life-like [Temnothorax nylanderi]|uniref:protein lethal(2)essential for life-like n=1 Tax=Temnothorax nylanderi TaxID=102681 RepID=UPI003A8525C3
MYLLPLLFSNLHLGLDAVDAPVGSLNPNLGSTSFVRPEDLTSRVLDRYYPTASFDRGVLDFYYRPWTDLLNDRHQHVVSSTNIDDDVFKLTLYVKEYNPEEVTVKVVDRWLVVEGKHEATQDDGNVLSRHSRQFVRKYLLPSRAEVDQIKTTFSSDGILIVTAPLKPNDERVIKIEQTGKPAVPPNSQKEAGESETVPAVERKSKDNEVVRDREEVTATQAQEAGPKPEK